MILFVLISMMTHMIFVVSLRYMDPPTLIPQQEKIEVEYVQSDELSSPEQKKKQTKNKIIDQIVEQKDQLNDEIDEKTNLLSAFNQKVIKQTRADQAGQFNNKVAGGQPTEGQRDGDKKTKAESTKKTHIKGELPDLEALKPKFAIMPGPKGPQLDKTGTPAQTDDYLKELAPGMQTLLSTREFVYYAYYARIKEALRQHWEPTVREKVKIIYRTGRSIASSKDRITQVMVTLNAKGELIRVDVLSASGVEALDSAAVEAFQNASPFPNPPKGMVEQDGTVKIRWDFVLEA